ncbi:ABC transporter ATP-binding protein [Halomicrococcus sp. NG-SE-24]|uniref:ABC transporter ATP-binding protein n=1 Tax=Halomicrococcus sp. NG-SE-24 TaxID=3436928 RepID=UPI003D99330E
MTVGNPTTDSAELGGAGERIHLENVRKEFGELVAVNDLSLRIREGEFLVLLGPSGCGKTTTLRMIAGLETPTGGEISIGDETVTRTLPQERELSMVFQSYALYPHKTVRENLAFPLGKMDLDDDERETRIRRVAETLEIAGLLDKDPGQLSGGQRQRVALGRTIIREPRAFLMDEPLSNLDARLRVQTRAELRALQQDLGTTTVYVTHDQEEAMSLADRIAVMKDGELQQVGPPEDVYEQPTNEFVAGFIGEPAMNFFALTADDRPTLFPDDPVPLGTSLPEAAETVGVRPEHVHLASEVDGETPSTMPPFECGVDVVEPLGNAYEVELVRGTTTFTARQRSLPDNVATDATVDVVFDTDAVHAFDASGAALLEGGEVDG